MSGTRTFAAGDRVLLVDARQRRYMITLEEGKQFHSHQGSVAHDDLIGLPEGTWVSTHGGARMLAVRPTLSDYVLKMRRGAQVIYPKDIAAIILYADIFPGARTVEAGTGSGSLTLALARAVGSDGVVISYEVREDHHATALRNIEAWYQGFGGKPDNIELRLGDVFAGVPETDIDRIVLDVAEPWRAVGAATDSLTPGGILCCYLPTVPQVSRTVEEMRAGGFGLIGTFEVLLRTWNVDDRSVRPDHRMVAHTGFVITGRKLTTTQDSRRSKG